MKQYRRHLILLVAVLVWLVTSACESSVPERNGRLSTTAGPGTDGTCKILVTVGPPPLDLRLDVTVSTEAGITLSDTGSQLSNPQFVELLAQGERVVSFDCELDPTQINGSGEYIVRSVARYAGTDQVYDGSMATLMVVQMADGSWRSLPFAGADPIFSRDYRAGQIGVSSDINLEGTTQPTGGMMYIKVASEWDGFAPQMVLETLGGIQFQDRGTRSTPIQSIEPGRVVAQFGPIMAGGSRIIYVPFAMDSGSLAGRYNVRITLIDNGNTSVENAAVAIRIVEEDGAKWMLKEHNNAPVEMRPELVNVSGVGSVAPEPVEPDLQSQPELPLTPEVNPAAPPAPTPQLIIPEFEVEQPLQPAAPPLPPKGNAAISWSYRLTGYFGNRYDIWSRLVQPNTGMEWEEFNSWAAVYNPVLVTDGYVFYAEKGYWLPELSTVYSVQYSR